MAEKITANDLGNGKFLFNFTTEEDLKYVLSQGPFHYNFCMFVLVRWEPIVHDDYPWIIPFWVQLIGFPLHLWTDKNLENIGGRIGYIDTMELSEGRMLIDVDSRRPLKFSRKVDYKGDEVTIEIKYDMLFKHCTLCGMLAHEKGYCPSLDTRSRIQHPRDRSDVFTRVQLPLEQPSHKLKTGDARAGSQPNAYSSRQSSLKIAEAPSRYSSYQATKHDLRNNLRERASEDSSIQSRSWEERRSRGNHTDRIIRRRDDSSRSNRYGGARSGTRPYDRRSEHTWRAKTKRYEGDDIKRADGDVGTISRVIVPYEQGPVPSSLVSQNYDQRRTSESAGRKLASTIVTPSRMDHQIDDNVTVRNRGDAVALTFSPLREHELRSDDDQIIGALNDMELLDPQDGGLMEDDAHGDDLLGLDLMEMEATRSNPMPLVVKESDNVTKLSRHRKLGVKRGASLGNPSRKFEILRRGSPSKCPTLNSTHVSGGAAKSSALAMDQRSLLEVRLKLMV